MKQIIAIGGGSVINYTKETKLSVNSAVEKFMADLKTNNWGVLGVIDMNSSFQI